MAVFLFFFPKWTGFYIAYVIVFSMLVGPVFSAGAVTQERERQTIELLLTTLLKPGQIIFAKLVSSLRVSTVLTLLLTEQILLAFVMVEELYPNWMNLLIYFAIILATCLLTSTLGLFCSVLCRKTSAALILTYLIMLALFLGPIALMQFLLGFTEMTELEIGRFTLTSPFAAILSVPLWFRDSSLVVPGAALAAAMPVYWYYLGIAIGLSFCLLLLMDLLFRLRWRAASQS
jgi:ABC-type transport system involved in multi-copper enzyme maturation permease subunit